MICMHESTAGIAENLLGREKESKISCTVFTQNQTLQVTAVKVLTGYYRIFFFIF